MPHPRQLAILAPCGKRIVCDGLRPKHVQTVYERHSTPGTSARFRRGWGRTSLAIPEGTRSSSLWTAGGGSRPETGNVCYPEQSATEAM